MIPQPYQDQFQHLEPSVQRRRRLLARMPRAGNGKQVYVICAVNRRGPDYELVPFARLFDDNPYELLAASGRDA